MRRYIDIPECWEEMTTRQYKYLLGLYFRMMESGYVSESEALVDFADFLLGRKKYIHPVQNQRYLLLVSDIASKLAWLFGHDSELVFLDFNTTQNLLPVIDGLVGPQSHGADLLFGEYRVAIDYYNRYTTGHDPEALDALVGILYRRPTKEKVSDRAFDGQAREHFNRYRIDQYAGLAKHLPEPLKWGVYLWFGNLCRYIVEDGLFVIEGNEVSFSSIFWRQSPDIDAREDSLGMMAVLFSLADTGTFGNANETDETELFSVLLKLLHDKQLADKMNAK